MLGATSLGERDHLEAGQSVRRALKMRVGGSNRRQDAIDFHAMGCRERDHKSVSRLHQAMVMRTCALGGADAAQFIERRSMKLDRGGEHGMIGCGARASGGCQNQNAGDLGCYLAEILKTLASFQDVRGSGIVYYLRCVHCVPSAGRSETCPTGP